MHKALNRTLLTHPHLVHPRTGLPLAALGFRKDGRPIWPVLGASPDDDGNGDGGSGGDGGSDKPKTFDQAAVDKIVADRLARERAKYADYDDLKTKAGQYDDHVAATATETEKAIAAAKKEAGDTARAEVLAKVGGQLVTAHIRGEVGGRIPKPQLDILLEHLDAKAFLTAAGEVDTAKVDAYVAGIAPAKPAPNLQQGHRANAGDGSATVAAGRDLWAERHPKKTTS